MAKKFNFIISRRMLSITIPLFILFNSCAKEKHSNQLKNKLELRNTYQLNIPEPSGLTLSPDRKSLFTVSDETGMVYVLSTGGKLLRSFKVHGEDLEGITFINDSTIAVVLERSREIIFCNTDGTELEKISTGLKGDLNSGLEGIAYDSSEGEFYLINEKTPALLIKADKNLKIFFTKVINYVSDLSGLSLSEDFLWILSDESKLIAKCDKEGEVIETYKIPVQQPEGIAVNSEQDLIYIVSDFTGILYVFKFIH
ncbi:MAG: SdiA-regulated domain-containing protein [Ignavibacteriaceae bacterium]